MTRVRLAVIVLALTAVGAIGHESRFSPEENAWLERQYARDGMKCCNEHDVHVGVDVRWRFVNGRYEVMMDGRWTPVPEGRLMRHTPNDPSPWGAAPLLFYTPGQHAPWCFLPEPLM